MKILGRTFIILAAALAVVAVTIGLVGTDTSSAGAETEQGMVFQEQGAASTGKTVTTAQVSGRPHEEGHDEASLFGIVSVLQNLVTIGVIVLVVTLGGRAWTALARLSLWRHNS